MTLPPAFPVEFAAPGPLQVGAVAWPDRATMTIVVKTTFGVDERGGARFLQPGRALVLDVVDPDYSELIFPSDFAVQKPSCDVVIAGQAVRDRKGPAVLVCGNLEKRAADRGRLGAREIFCPSGDPNDPSAEKAWASGSVGPARFQMAAPDQRMPSADFPLRISYQRGDLSIATTIGGPRFEAVLVDPRQRSAAQVVALRVDSVLILAKEKQVVLLFRGLLRLPPGAGVAPLLAVAPGSLASYRHDEIFTWPRARLVLPGDTRASSASENEAEDLLARTQKRSDLPPFADDESAHDPSEFETMAVVTRPREDPLPFTKATPARGSGLRATPGAFNPRETLLSGDHATDSDDSLTTDLEEEAREWDGTGTELARGEASDAIPFRAPARSDGPPMATRSSTAPVIELARQALALGFQLGGGEVNAGVLQAVHPSLNEIETNSLSPETLAAVTMVPATISDLEARPAPQSLAPATLAPFTVAPVTVDIPQSPPLPVLGLDDESRFRSIQQAIWKGDRELSDILGAHGLNETEWRAMKRDALKKVGR